MAEAHRSGPGDAEERRRPDRLKPGDRVAVVSPSGPVPEERMDAGVQHLRGWGLDVVIAPHAADTHRDLDYLAGSDADRAADLQDAWLDPQIDAIICARGGYGAQRMIDLLDFDAMRHARPKVLAGYSDITALHEAFATQLGVVTLHAPMVGAEPFLSDADSREALRQMLFTPEDATTLGSPDTRILVPGSARGVMVGGCLAVLAGEVGSAVARRDLTGALVLLEDVGEDAYRLDGFLTHLLRAGWFDGAAGVIAGSWHNCNGDIDALLLDRLGDLGVPVVTDFGFGHSTSSITVPLGVTATLDNGVVHLAQPALA